MFYRSRRKAPLLRVANIVRINHRLRAIQSGLISPDRTVCSWSNTCVMTENNPFTVWEVIDFKCESCASLHSKRRCIECDTEVFTLSCVTTE